MATPRTSDGPNRYMWCYENDVENSSDNRAQNSAVVKADNHFWPFPASTTASENDRTPLYSKMIDGAQMDWQFERLVQSTCPLLGKPSVMKECVFILNAGVLIPFQTSSHLDTPIELLMDSNNPAPSSSSTFSASSLPKSDNDLHLMAVRTLLGGSAKNSHYSPRTDSSPATGTALLLAS